MIYCCNFGLSLENEMPPMGIISQLLTTTDSFYYPRVHYISFIVSFSLASTAALGVSLVALCQEYTVSLFLLKL